MTKKSAARQQRDLEKKLREQNKEEALQKPVWTEVACIYNQCIALMATNSQIHTVISNGKLTPHFRDHKQLIQNIQILSRDLTQVKNELAEINAQHQDKIGSPVDVDDYAFAMHVGEQYAAWMERYEGVIMPTVRFINEQVYEAELSLKNADPETSKVFVKEVSEKITKFKDTLTGESKLTPEQDPSVVTDVEAKPAETQHEH